MENEQCNTVLKKSSTDMESSLTSFVGVQNCEKTISNEIENGGKRSKTRTTLLLFGLACCIFCSAFPTAGLGPSLGKISYVYDRVCFTFMYVLSQYTNFINLTTTVAIFQLLCVRIGDCFGRRRVFLTAMVLFFIVIILGSFSVNSGMLITCRALQGCLSGLCQSSVATSIVDMFELRDRVVYEPMVYAAFGATSIIGPVLGGVFVDHLSWRFIFWLTAILFVPSLIIIYFLLDIPIKPEQTLSKENVNTLLKRIDPIGCLLAATGIAFFLLGMHFPSASMGYTWSSPLVVGFIAGSGGILVLFLIFEKFITPRPLFPSHIFKDYNLIAIYIQSFTNGFVYIFFDVLIFIQLQAVYDATTTQAAIRLVPGTVCLITSSITGSKLITKFGKAKYINIIGNSLIVLACLLILYAETPDSGIALQIICLMIYNAGIGFSGQSNVVSLQLMLEKNAPHLIATALTLNQFIVISSGAICVSIVMTMLRTQVSIQMKIFENTHPIIYQEILKSGADENYIKVRDIVSKDLHYIVQSIYYNSIQNIIYVFLAMGIMGLICALILQTPSLSNIEQEKKNNSQDK